MAENATGTDLQTFKDFLTQYNIVAEMCFNACVNDFTERHVNTSEDSCCNNCLDKFLKVAQRLAIRFQEHQLLSTEVQGLPTVRR